MVADRLTIEHPELRHMLAGLKFSLREFATWIRSRPGEASAGNTKGKRPANRSTDFHPSRSTKRKHPATGDEEPAEDSHDDEQQGKKARLQAGETDEDDGPLLACPFYKRNPIRHSRCLLFRLKRVTDVKQHLRRKHVQPHYCAFCSDQFESQVDLKGHERRRSCTQKEFDEPDGVTEDQSRRLGSRVSRKKTEAEQWFEIWAILFPGAESPGSVYVESPALEIISTFQGFWDEVGEEVVAVHLQESMAEPAVPTGQVDIKEMLRVLLLESMGTLLDRFTQRFSRTPPSVSETGTAPTPTPSSNPVQPEDTRTSTSGGNPRFLSNPVSMMRLAIVPAVGQIHGPDLRQMHGSATEFAPMSSSSPSRMLSNTAATVGHSEVLQGDYPEWETAFPDILSNESMQNFDTWLDSLVHQEASTME